MKKFLALVLSLVLALGMCAISTPASADENVDLIVWILGPGEQADHEKVMTAFNEKLHETLPNITADITIISGDIKDQLSRMWAAGERVDLCWIGWHHSIAQEAIDGNILPLNDLLEQYGQGIIETLGEATIDNHRIDGELYQVPSWQGMVGGRSGLYIPVEALNDSGVGDDWLATAQEAMYAYWQEPTVEKQQGVFDLLNQYYQGLVDNGKIRAGIGTGEPYIHVGLDSDYGVVGWSSSNCYIEMNDDTFTVKPSYTSDLKKNVYKHFAEAYDKGYIRSDIASVEGSSNWNDGFDDLDNIIAGHNAWTDNYDVSLTKTYGIDMTLIYDMPHNWYSLGRATGMCIPYTSEHPEEAMMFLNEMYTNKDLYRLYVYGIEGEHWEATDDENGAINVFGGSAQPTSDWTYGQWVWAIGTCENCCLTQNAANDPAYYEELKELEKNAYSSPMLNFNFDKINVETQVSALSAITKEYEKPLQQGYLGGAGWEAYYNEFIDQLYANGIEDVVAEMQSQVNAYIEANNITGWNYNYADYLK